MGGQTDPNYRKAQNLKTGATFNQAEFDIYLFFISEVL